ncbi:MULTISPECIES: UDP-N-acetylmuramate dehydrogenase [unclassified Leeuwenhoekiella]|uniref:UDP-N-acetylmuramate dehydrogenase n=1 Tax=unclassified Leeuwenhoekiella TaxID=2615029 RepID=UPI000C4E196D|nr:MULTISPECIES: UDP-N-acetylmuramate dehydrogenase [unclassified Leeuwenhoekiella]MAW96527.1 UDP-N-acetylenolpyruvoylglucosamine reductase [Leeuwenhoekiella sp.]MBA81414.1 UDP-N-acetylenolpyruvoylglucosamine reductase [Leeuwenhoekiella sp.]|tara:strand:+ start:28119 stop:29135 length:1017 start_codon:yes stop_codon:yes gene_type:complete
MNLQHHVSLKAYNTFGIPAKAETFVSATSVQELKEALSHPDYPNPFILGGGSNMLFKRDIDGLVVHVALKGIKIVDEDDNHVWVEVAAGENWHQFVMYCVEHGYGGVENLALIPGNTGTAPVQNIGAYGVELKDVFHACTAIDRNSLKERNFSLADCNFGYRESVFKNELKDRFVITSVTFKLTKANHQLHTEYGAIQQTLEDEEITHPGIKDIANAVIAIRSSKLPDPKELGNSGSFFKNPIISREQFERLQETFPQMPHYVISDTDIKIPAGWLIEQAGFKGKRYGDAGVHKNQALVLVNYGNATGAEIWDLALRVKKEVQEQFGIIIEPEVNIIE